MTIASTTVDLVGQPVPQGSMTCVGRNGFHQVQPSNKKALAPWRRLIAKAGEALAQRGGKPEGPVVVEATFTIARPTSVPLRERRWPWKKSPGHGDLDKLLRALNDGLTGPLLTDDAQVCEIHARKVYPDTLDAPPTEPSTYVWATGPLVQPGVSIALRSLT